MRATVSTKSSASFSEVGEELRCVVDDAVEEDVGSFVDVVSADSVTCVDTLVSTSAPHPTRAVAHPATAIAASTRFMVSSLT